MIAIFAFALWHPAMRDLTQPAEDYEDEEEGIGYR